MTTLRQRMLEDLRIRNYAPTTVACYIRSVAEFAQHFNKPPDQLGPEEIRAWQLFLLNEKRVKLSTYIQGSGANAREAGDDEEMQRFVPIEDLFRGRHFDRQIIIWCVSWYTSFKLSLRDLVIMMADQGSP
jgi:Phage integrase, N-terminal SAM-like domain